MSVSQILNFPDIEDKVWTKISLWISLTSFVQVGELAITFNDSGLRWLLKLSIKMLYTIVHSIPPWLCTLNIKINIYTCLVYLSHFHILHLLKIYIHYLVTCGISIVKWSHNICHYDQLIVDDLDSLENWVSPHYKSLYIYGSDMALQWNMCFKTTAMRDHLSCKTTLAGTWTYIFYIFVPLIKDHLLYVT